MTQKPTSDALPTAIRDNASVRTAWRVVTDDAAEAILGPVVRRSDITPVDIGEEMRGVAVVANAAGRLERVRFPYVDEHTAETIATRVADLRRELTEFGAPAMKDDGDGGSKDGAQGTAEGVRA